MEDILYIGTISFANYDLIRNKLGLVMGANTPDSFCISNIIIKTQLQILFNFQFAPGFISRTISLIYRAIPILYGNGKQWRYWGIVCQY